MQEIQAHVIDIVKQNNKSIAQIARETALGETTVRRFMNGEDCSVNTLAKIAAVVGITTDDLRECIPTKTAVAMEMVKQELEQEFKPYTEQCANACPARKAFNENLNHIESLYRERIDDHQKVIAEKDFRIKRFRIASFVLLGIVFVLILFIIYLIFIDFANPTWGIFQYPTAYWHEVVPQAFLM